VQDEGCLQCEIKTARAAMIGGDGNASAPLGTMQLGMLSRKDANNDDTPKRVRATIAPASMACD
jgi:hypothetical protein